MAPEILAATFLSLSKIIVVGIDVTGNEFLNPKRILSSVIVGYVILNLREKANAESFESLVKLSLIHI